MDSREERLKHLQSFDAAELQTKIKKARDSMKKSEPKPVTLAQDMQERLRHYGLMPGEARDAVNYTRSHHSKKYFYEVWDIPASEYNECTKAALFLVVKMYAAKWLVETAGKDHFAIALLTAQGPFMTPL